MIFYREKNKILALAAILAMLASSALFASNSDDSWILNRQGIYKISKGNTEGAIDDFEKACQIDPFNDTALSNLACARNNLGVEYAKQHRYSEAIRQFCNAKSQKPEDVSIRLNLLSTLVTVKRSSEADKEIQELIDLRPNDGDLIIKLATAYQKLENSPAAMSILQEYTERNSSDKKAYYSLSRLMYLNGNLAESRFYLTKSIDLDPNDRKSLEFLAKLDKETSVEQATNSFSGNHFELVCPESFSESWAESILEELENAYEEVGSKLNFYPEQKAYVVLLQTDDFKSVHDLPDWAGGVYDGKIRLPVPKNILPKALKGAIFHEYTHHVIYLASSGNCPVWLNEGLAQIFEKGLENLKETAEYKQDEAINLYSIDSGFRKNPDRATAANLYKLSFNATYRLISEYNWNQVADILHLLSLGKTFNEAVKDVLGESLKEVESRIIASN